MIEKLEQLKTTLDSHTSGDMVISKELYDLLLSEKDKINELSRLVAIKRDESVLRVNLGDLVSEQIDEFPVPEIGLTREMIRSITSLMNEVNCLGKYDGSFEKEEVRKVRKKMSRILNKGPEIPKRFDAFEKKPKGMVAVYDILQDCYMNEFFKNMNFNNYEEIIQSFGPMTMNLMQIDWLFKNGKLLLETEYVILTLIDEKFRFLKVYCHRGKTVKWFPTELSKGKKLLLFNPTDIDSNAKTFLEGRKNRKRKIKKTSGYH